MSNAKTHQIASGLGVLSIYAAHEYAENGELSIKPFIAGGMGAVTASLPDIIEPAFHNPNHRQFFHSFGFAGLLGYGLYNLYQWQPEDDVDKAMKFIGLAIGASYLIHLICDSGTTKGLPLIGRI